MDREFAAVEAGRHEWLEHTVHQPSKASPMAGRANAHPKGPIGTTAPTRDAGLSCVGFQRFDRVRLRDAFMPVDKGSLSSEPKSPFPITQ